MNALLRTLYYIIVMSVIFMAVAAINGAAAKVVGNTYVGIEMKEKHIVINVVKKYMKSIFIASFLCYLAVTLGFCFLLLPGFFFMVSWFLYDPVIALEGKTAYDGLARSWELTSGYRFEVLCAIILMDSSIILICVCWYFMVVLCSSNYIVQLIFGGLPMFILMPFRGIVKTVVYLNLRVIKEKLNQQKLFTELALLENLEEEKLATDDYEGSPIGVAVV